MSSHDSHNQCSHASIKHCAACDVAYCANCTMQWSKQPQQQQYWYNGGLNGGGNYLNAVNTTGNGGTAGFNNHNHQ